MWSGTPEQIRAVIDEAGIAVTQLAREKPDNAHGRWRARISGEDITFIETAPRAHEPVPPPAPALESRAWADAATHESRLCTP